ncbi:hypothetical protein J3F83DRAFT_210748 [Trichoderma novae-zelandiae]
MHVNVDRRHSRRSNGQRRALVSSYHFQDACCKTGQSAEAPPVSVTVPVTCTSEYEYFLHARHSCLLARCCFFISPSLCLDTHSGAVKGLLAAARASASAQSILEQRPPKRFVRATPDCWVNHPRPRAKATAQACLAPGQKWQWLPFKAPGDSRTAWAWAWHGHGHGHGIGRMDAAASETVVASRPPPAS